MKRDDLFPSKYLKAADLKGRALVVEIEAAAVETLKNGAGEEQEKVVLHFAGKTKTLPLNMTNFDAVAAIAGDDETDTWGGCRIELYPSKTDLRGKTVDCVRIRPPQELPIGALKAKAPPKASPPAGDMGDEIPF